MQDAAVEVSLYVLAAVPNPVSPALLTPGELRRAESFVHERDRRAFVGAHTLLRLAVADRLALSPSEFALDFTCARCGEQHGPPRILAGPGAGIAVSLTRSSGVVAVALLDPGSAAPLTPGARLGLGVDIERLDAVVFDGFDEVALSPAERARLALLANTPAAASARAALWVRKEAVAKALGSGLRRDPRDIEVLAGETSAERLRTANRIGDGRGSGEAVVDGHRVAWRDVPLGRGDFAAAVAVAGATPGTGIRVALCDATPLFSLDPDTPTAETACRGRPWTDEGCAGQAKRAATGLVSRAASSAATSS